MTVTGSREALRECPFCGRRPTGIAVSQQFAPVCDVVCGCGGSMNSCNDEADAIEAWNTRASPDPAGVPLTVEEIARIIDPWAFDLTTAIMDNVPGGQDWRAYKKRHACRKATAILSLIQKPATSGTAAPVCELGDRRKS